MMRWPTICLGIAAFVPYAFLALPQDEPKAPAPAQVVHDVAKRLFARAKDEDFAGNEFCASCHESQVSGFKHSGHAVYMNDPKLPLNQRGCEGCHGPGMIHQSDENPEVISFKKLSPVESSKACLRCHGTTMKTSQWHATAHSQANVACTSCHQIHPTDPAEAKRSPFAGQLAVHQAIKPNKALLKGDEATLCNDCHRAEVGQFKKHFHHPVPEGKLTCSDCHALHPSKSDAKRHGELKKDCVSCHAEKAGPFVFEHDMGSGGTGASCTECHGAHGSQNPKLLNSFSRGLCSQCHTDKSANHFPGRTCWSAGCHGAVHGSNSDRRLIIP